MSTSLRNQLLGSISLLKVLGTGQSKEKSEHTFECAPVGNGWLRISND